MLHGLPARGLNRLQYVQNSAARVLTHTRSWEHISPTLKQLHWLPVQHHVRYKLLVLVFKSLNGHAPSYLGSLLQLYSPARALRSSDSHLLKVPPSKLHTVGDVA